MKKLQVLHQLATIGAVCLTFVALGSTLAQAQRTVSLTQMPCLTTSGRANNTFVSGSANIAIGQEIYTGIAVLRTDQPLFGGSYISPGDPAGVACRITPAGSKPRFRTLRIAFGISNTGEFVRDNSHLRLTVFVDGNTVGSKEIVKGSLEYMLVDVTNAWSVALRGECLSDTCPGIIFVQTLLEEAPSSPGRR
ncbi:MULTISPECIES: hypothetical protein [unclassified Microcoleus]|uniref:hypothetical protein n=1 Tax=unclassified Microcoleus TaxID=2642155 RepID=UPI002FD3C919